MLHFASIVKFCGVTAPGAGWGGTPDNGKLFFQQWPNHAHEYNQSDSGLSPICLRFLHNPATTSL